MKSLMHKNSLYLATGTMVLAGTLLTINTFADGTDVVDEINITVPVSCTMSGSGMTSHNADISNGTYQADIGTTTLHAFCNDNSGFAIYATGYTEDEIGATNSNKLVGTSASGNATIVTGTATSAGDPDASNWAMKLAITQDSGDTTGTNAFAIDNSFNAYHEVPNSYTKVAHKNAGTDMTAITGGVKLTTTYAAYISKTQPADTYSGQVIYTLVHPSDEVPLQPQTTEPGKICYYPNGSNVEGTMGCQDISSSDTSATLLASNFSREGYGFAGWSTTYDYKATGENAHFYGPQEDITFTAGQYTGDNNGLSLYAYWIKSAGNLQGWTGCSSMASGAVTALTDQRDNETYAVAKLADDNCWMIENMRLENTNSDNATGALAQGYGGQFAGLADPEVASLFTSTATANTLYSTDGSTDRTIPGSDQGYRFPRYNNVNTPTTATGRPSNPTSNSATNSTSNAGMYSYGNYYTWAAAIADTTDYSSGDHGTTSICPSGWRLPIGNQSTANMSFGKLSVELGGPANGATANSSSTPTGTKMSKVFRSYPNNFVYSGYVDNGSVGYRGSYGLYWSSAASSNVSAYNMYFYSSSVRPGSGVSGKYVGRTIRCLASGV